MKKQLLLMLLIGCSLFSRGQSNLHHCEGIHFTEQPYTRVENGTNTNSETPELRIYDSYGNRYGLENIARLSNQNANRTTFETCDSGYFTLDFMDDSGFVAPAGASAAQLQFYQDRRDVVCKVFKDISDMIESPLTTTGNTVKIWIRNIADLTTSPTAAGVASTFYNIYYYASYPDKTGIMDGLVWKTIQSGEDDAFVGITFPLGTTNNAAPSYYHGQAAFNVDIYEANNVDLYSVVLHEALHMLGFASMMRPNGTSVISGTKYYSRYDSFLRSPNGTPLITPSSACTISPDYVLNNASLLAPNCTSSTPTNQSYDCNNIITFEGISSIPVYNPGCFEQGSSLSHFEDQCYINPATNVPYGNDNYFVMSNSILPGSVKQQLTLEERQALCNFGYTLNNTGGLSCSGVQVAGVYDGINSNGAFSFVGAVGNPLTISGILNNDYNATGFDCLKDLTDPSANLNVTNGGTGTNILLTSNVEGIHILQYIPVHGYNRGNITYIYTYFTNGIVNTCNTTTACNLVVNGNFEEGEIPFQLSQIEKACNWISANELGTVDYYHRNSNYIHTKIPDNFVGTQEVNSATGGDAYVGLMASDNDQYTPGGTYREILATKLATPLKANSTYKLVFDVSRADKPSYNHNAWKFQAFLSSQLPVTIGLGELDISSDPTGILVEDSVFHSNETGWETVTLTFTTGATAGQEYLYIGGIANTSFEGSTANGGRTYYYLDNVNLNQVHSVTLPETLCINATTLDLTTFTTSTISSISGVGVVGNTFNPATAGVGSHVITYVLNNDLGCEVTLTDTIQVLSATDCGDNTNCDLDFTINEAISRQCNVKNITLNYSTNITGYTVNSYTWTITNTTDQSVPVVTIQNQNNTMPTGLGYYNFPTSGVYNVTLQLSATAPDGKTCEKLVTQSVTIDCDCEFDFNLTGFVSSRKCPVGVFVPSNFPAQNSEFSLSYVWTINKDGQVVDTITGNGTPTQLNYTFTTNGNYTVCLDVTGKRGGGMVCHKVKKCVDVTVDCISTNNCSLDYTINHAISRQCNVKNITLNYLTDTTGYVLNNYTWTITNTTNQSVPVVTIQNQNNNFPTGLGYYNFSTSGVYNVTLNMAVTAPDGSSCEKQVVHTITIDCECPFDFDLTGSINPRKCPVGVFVPSNLPTQNSEFSLSYIWNIIKDGQLVDTISGTGSPTQLNYTFTTNGNYTVCLTVTGSRGGGMICHTIKKCVDVKVDCLLGIKSRKENKIGTVELFPNPNKGKFNLKFDKEVDLYKVFIYDLVGNEIFMEQFKKSNSCLIDISKNKPGIYLIKIVNAKSTFTQKVLVQ